MPVWSDRTDPSPHPTNLPPAHFDEARLQVWLTEAPVSQRLWGSGDDVLKMTNFVDLTSQKRLIAEEKEFTADIRKKNKILSGLGYIYFALNIE